MQDITFSAVLQCSTDENIFPNTVEENLCSWLYTPGGAERTCKQATSRSLQQYFAGCLWVAILDSVLVVAVLQFTIRAGEAK